MSGFLTLKGWANPEEAKEPGLIEALVNTHNMIQSTRDANRQYELGKGKLELEGKQLEFDKSKLTLDDLISQRDFMTKLFAFKENATINKLATNTLKLKADQDLMIANSENNEKYEFDKKQKLDELTKINSTSKNKKTSDKLIAEATAYADKKRQVRVELAQWFRDNLDKTYEDIDFDYIDGVYNKYSGLLNSIKEY